MGFGLNLCFNLLCFFILFPLTIILCLVWMFSRKKLLGIILLCIWSPIIGLILLSITYRFFTEKMEVDRNDMYGEYVIDRDVFPGKQADWQYNHFRFEITRDDKMHFYVTANQHVLKEYVKSVEIIEPYEGRPRLKLNMSGPTHHIIDSNPTLYRKPFSFYYVFSSAKFNNVFFKKGHWKKLSN
jgi:hypothetical protein